VKGGGKANLGRIGWQQILCSHKLSSTSIYINQSTAFSPLTNEREF
jgi:hypothetical protein